MKKIPIFADLEPFNNLKELMHISAERYSERYAFSYEKKKEIVNVSYLRFRSDTEALSTYIYSLGISNANIAVIGENAYEWIVSYFSTVTVGNVIVPLDKDLSNEEIKTLLLDSESQVLLYADSYSDIVEYIKETCKDIRWYIPFNSFSDLIAKGQELIKNGQKDVLEKVIDSNDLAAIIYTSGTTGNPKGVMLSHKNLSSNTVSCRHYVKVRGHSMMLLPMHHSFGFTTCVLYYLFTGSQMYISHSLKRIKEDFLKFKPYNVFMVPMIVESVYKRIWDRAKESGREKVLRNTIKFSNILMKLGIDVRKKLFKSLIAEFGGNFEYIITGGAPIDDIYIKGLCDIGIDTVNGYGITECSPVVSVNRLGRNKIGSAGEVYTCCKVRIDNGDEDGIGEILVKGENVMLGYYKNKELTEQVFNDGWFKTGDIGYLDKDNYIYITGRKKTMIVLNNGKNVFPEELEAYILREIKYISEVVVSFEENILVATIYIEPDIRDKYISRVEDDIKRVGANLVSYKRVSRVVLKDEEFEKTTTKKIKR